MYNKILAYYLSRFDELPSGKQFHLCSRLYLWCGYPGMRERLDRMYPGWALQEGSVPQTLRYWADHAPDLQPQVRALVNAAELREPYLQKYEPIHRYSIVLSMITFLRSIYGQDFRATFYELFNKAEVAAVAAQLLADKPAVAMLSTYAVNFLYNLKRGVDADEEALPPEYFLGIGRSQYDLRDKKQLELLIYLYTHCILGESRFYYRALPAAKLGAYRVMLHDLEKLISDRFDDIHLDNKLEFLVCCVIAQVSTPLRQRIMDEARDSLSDDGTFLIDRLNRNPQTNRTGLAASEHRNVLYVLANLKFKPQGQ